MEVFDTQTKDAIEELKKAYQRVFDSDDASVRIVLADLKIFCRADVTTFHPDARLHAVGEGRREVILRIFDQLNLNVDQLYERRQKKKKGQYDG